MKVWGWFAVAVLWLMAVAAVMLFGAFNITILTPKSLPQKAGAALVALLMNLILWGWLIPLSIAVLQLIRTKLVR